MWRFSLALLVCLFFLLNNSCKKESDSPTSSNKIEIGTTTTDTISYFFVQISTQLISTGGNKITQHGHCWSISEQPTIEDHHSNLGALTTPKAFSSELQELVPNTIYYIRAYVTLSNGTVYGGQQQIKTLKTGLPVVETGNISDVTITSVFCSGTVISDSGLVVTQKGTCWSKDPEPSLTNNIGFTDNSAGLGSFTDTILNLEEGNSYYIVAYATNEKGTAYGQNQSFETLDLSPCDGILSFNYVGQNYNTVEIGYQCWMKENLNIGIRIDGSQEQTNNSTIEKYCYNDNEANCDTYGGLYQWDEIMQYITQQGVQGICPQGWHIPKDGEWTILTDYLGGTSVAGGKMKENGTTHWNSPNTGATNSSSFTALPGGLRNTNGGFFLMVSNGYLWSSSELDATLAWRRSLYYNLNDVYRNDYNKKFGLSVRCLKD